MSSCDTRTDPSDPTRCTRCNERCIRPSGTAHTLGLCKRCWGAADYPDATGRVPEKCRHRTPDCSKWLRQSGPAWRNNLCDRCYRKLKVQTWKYFFPDSDFDYKNYDTHVLFVGNMPYTWREEDVITWINENSPARIDGKPYNFTVRCETGGSGDHGVPKKIFKKFAFVTFDLVEDAYKLLRECNSKQFNGSGRAVVAHPAVATGPPGRWLKQKLDHHPSMGHSHHTA